MQYKKERFYSTKFLTSNLTASDIFLDRPLVTLCYLQKGITFLMVKKNKENYNKQFDEEFEGGTYGTDKTEIRVG